MTWFYPIIFAPFLSALVVPLLYKKFNPRIHIGWFIFVIPLMIFFYLLSLVPSIANGQSLALTLPWIPSYDINLTANIDGLSLVFGLIITGIGFLVIWYSIYYMSKHKEALHNFYIYMLLFMGSMLGLVFIDNIFTLYAFWEMTSISSFLLIAFWFERQSSRAAASKSLLITVMGGLAMLAGFILLSMMADTHSIREMISRAGMIQSHDWFIPAMILILLGAFTKSAQFPFSTWLPDAMEAPTPISAYLHSATMVKAGIYLVARFTAIFGGSCAWFWLVTSAGLITLLYGSLNAVKQTDLKALLAYSTISQLGLIMSLLGLGSAALYFDLANQAALYAIAIFAAIFHLVNHSTFKGCLFMVVGIIDHETGTRDIRKLGGLLQLMPVSFLLALTGSFAMAGLPPFNGFLSKELFFTALLNAAQMPVFHMQSWGTILIAIGWMASVFTFVYCMIVLCKTFLGPAKDQKTKKKAHEAPFGMLIPPLLLAVLIIIIFLYPHSFSQFLFIPAWQAVLPTMAASLQIEVSAWHGFNTELWMTLGLVAVGILLYKTMSIWLRIYHYYPRKLTLNVFYESALEKTEELALALTRRYMTGSVRDYLIYILGFMIVLVGGAMLLWQGLPGGSTQDGPVSLYELAILIGLVITAVTVLLARSRVTAVIAIGALGLLVVFLFVLFRAPDLALTQLVVETVTTVLFLLCFYHLPKLRKENNPLRFKAVNAVIAAGVGLVMTILALSANAMRLFPSISSYYEKADLLAGANNIVNAILVDFRGFDTMLEILVLTMAGLGVFTLIKLRAGGGQKDEANQ